MTPHASKPLAQGLDSFSYYLHWRYGGQTVDQLLDRVIALGLSALQININGPRHRALTGTTTDHIRLVGERARQEGIALEVASGGTDPSKMRLVLELARQLGAEVVRTTVNETGSEEVIERAARNLRQIAPEYEESGIALAVENHEDLTAEQVVELLHRVDSPAVGAVYDSGNSIPFYKDPIEEARLLAPYVRTTHIKDHVLVRDGENVWSVGTALGAGRIPLKEIVDVLSTTPHLSRLMTQVCYGYAVRMPCEPSVRPALDLFDPIERPADDTEIWAPHGDGDHGYLEADDAHLEAASGHVETSVRYVSDLLS